MSVDVHRSKRVKNFLKSHCVNWACSKDSLDEELKPKAGCQVVSAGTNVHEEASSACIKSVFKYFKKELK